MPRTTWDGPIPGTGPMRMVIAGAPPPTRTIERIETELGWEFIQIYGLTETTPLLTMNRRRAEFDDLSPGERAAKLGRAGAPGDRCRDAHLARRRGARPRQPHHGRVLEPAGGDRRRDPTGRRRLDGPAWFHTGDGGHIDDDNYVTISDRKKDVIISGGENVSSIEVEDAIFSHPEVAEVAVIGVPDEKWGEMVMALVVTTPRLGADRTRPDRLHQDQAGRLQVPEGRRVPRRARPHGHRQAAEVQAARAVLGRPGQAGQLSRDADRALQRGCTASQSH